MAIIMLRFIKHVKSASHRLRDKFLTHFMKRKDSKKATSGIESRDINIQ